MRQLQALAPIFGGNAVDERLSKRGHASPTVATACYGELIMKPLVGAAFPARRAISFVAAALWLCAGPVGATELGPAPLFLGPSASDAAWRNYVHAASTPTPASEFGPLYAEVETRRLFADEKLFADATPRRSPEQILADYQAGVPWSNEALKSFVMANFILPSDTATAPATAIDTAPLREHIDRLWPRLTRPGREAEPGGSSLSLPESYVVPGGRFRELYYWDSYFTMLGLAKAGRSALVEAMIDDFGSLIDRYGHIPNGTRTYYLSRSQPPLFYAMVGLSKATSPAIRRRRLRWLKQEYAYWMAGRNGLKPGEARLHVVAMPDGSVLNRYFDIADSPRDESYAQDVALAARSGRPAVEVYRDLRAAAESGWDFSSRWMADGHSLETIDTSDLVEPDLNSLLYGLERAIESGCRRQGDNACSVRFGRQADRRASAVRRWLWDDGGGLFRDFDWRRGQLRPTISAATLYPLFTGLATQEQARRVASMVNTKLLAPGGLRTTTTSTGQQWDRPNGWAPLQWIGAEGLARYGERRLADEIRCRWLNTVQLNYGTSGKLMEKYDVELVRPGGGGEYPLQDGFGWTNGVVADMHCRTH